MDGDFLNGAASKRPKVGEDPGETQNDEETLEDGPADRISPSADSIAYNVLLHFQTRINGFPKSEKSRSSLKVVTL